MKALKTFGAIIMWIAATSILANFASSILARFSTFFDLSSLSGMLLFLILTMPEVFMATLFISVVIGYFFSTGKTSVIVISVSCGLMQIGALLSDLTSITTWVATIATLLGFGAACLERFAGTSAFKKGNNNG